MWNLPTATLELASSMSVRNKAVKARIKALAIPPAWFASPRRQHPFCSEQRRSEATPALVQHAEQPKKNDDWDRDADQPK
jgi:hypothetical protein